MHSFEVHSNESAYSKSGRFGMEQLLYVHVYVAVEGMYTCTTGHVGNEDFCLCLCCCRGNIHTEDWEFSP